MRQQLSSSKSLPKTALFFVMACLPLCLLAKQQPEGSEAVGKPSSESAKAIEAAWDALLADTAPQGSYDPILTVEQDPVEKGPVGDFLNHFYLQTTTQYTRDETSFSGLPTATFVIDADLEELANTEGIPFRDAFQPNTDRIYSFMNWGTRSWLAPGLNSNFSLRYRQDLSHVTDGSPSLSILNTFGANRRVELLSAYVEAIDMIGSGLFDSNRIRLGRQQVYGAEWAALDGASIALTRPGFSLTLFGGRRFTHYSDPEKRAIGGANIGLGLPGQVSFDYETLYYVKGSHRLTFRKRLSSEWHLKTYFKMVGSTATDYSADVYYSANHQKSDFRFGFHQQLSNNDFFFDYTSLVTDGISSNRVTRLNLGPLSPHSQFMVEARRDLTPRLRAGGSIWIRRLNDSEDQGPFDVSFDDYRVSLQTFPAQGWETFLEFHQRNADRFSPVGVTRFDDVSRAGETRVQDLIGEVRYSFAEGGLTLKGGAFYNRISLQDRFFFIENAHLLGVQGGASVKLDRRSRLHIEYGLDNDYFIFRPSIKRGQVFRLRLDWDY